GQQALNHCLCGNTGMILAGNPECFIALHTMITNQNVFYRSSNRVAQMKSARHIGRWHTNHKVLASSTGAWLKVVPFFPEAIPFALNCLWLIRLWQGCNNCLAILLMVDHLSSVT